MLEINSPDVFPNPVTSGELFVTDAADNVNSISFTNVLGQSVKMINFERTRSENKKIDVSELTKGIYFLSINSTKGMHSKKIIIE